MSNYLSLIESLKSIQREQHLTDSQMAERLGCARQLYQATKTGKISVGLTILKGTTMAFPELIGNAIYFLTDGAQGLTTSQNINTTPSQTAQNKILAYLPRWLMFLYFKFRFLQQSKVAQALKSKSRGIKTNESADTN